MDAAAEARRNARRAEGGGGVVGTNLTNKRGVKGMPAKNHAKENVDKIREAQRLNRDREEDEANRVEQKFRLKQFDQVDSRVKADLQRRREVAYACHIPPEICQICLLRLQTTPLFLPFYISGMLWHALAPFYHPFKKWNK